MPRESHKVEFFLGANAPGGFYSLYDQLIDPADARRILILKGGPGCGKSTLMRQVGAAMEERGYVVEYILCSGDPASLDGIVIPSLRTALADGTAPHVIEPNYPGLVEEYVNLGVCYDRAGLQPVRGEIMGCMEAYRGHYRRAYRCLSAAAQIDSDIRTLAGAPEEKLRKRARGIFTREIKQSGRERGRSVQRFLSGVTHMGRVCLYGTAETLCGRIYELSDSYGLAHVMLTQLAAGAMAAGYDIIACPSPTAPNRMEHLLIPSLSLGFVSTRPDLRRYDAAGERRPFRRLRLDAMIDPDAIRRNRARLRFSRKIAAALTDEAVECLDQAKQLHDKLEGLYNPHVDFDRVHKMADQIVRELAN